MYDKWSLEVLYTGFEDEKFTKDMAKLDAMIEEYQKFADSLGTGEVKETVKKSLQMEEEFTLLVDRLYSYCSLRQSVDTSPIAPHLYFPRFVDDNNPRERYFGMEAGKRLMEQCVAFHVVIVDGVVSEGMQAEIKYMTEVLRIKGNVQYLTKADVQRIMEDRLER